MRNRLDAIFKRLEEPKPAKVENSQAVRDVIGSTTEDFFSRLAAAS
jgi:hypothetical protein